MVYRFKPVNDINKKYFKRENSNERVVGNG